MWRIVLSLGYRGSLFSASSSSLSWTLEFLTRIFAWHTVERFQKQLFFLKNIIASKSNGVVLFLLLSIMLSQIDHSLSTNAANPNTKSQFPYSVFSFISCLSNLSIKKLMPLSSSSRHGSNHPREAVRTRYLDVPWYWRMVHRANPRKLQMLQIHPH